MSGRGDLPRRAVVAGGAAAAGIAAMAPLGRARAVGSSLKAKAEGEGRVLPDRLFGFNSVVAYDVPHEDPAFIEAVKYLDPHWLRFPGGTVANYFNWRSGQLDVADIGAGASVYRKYILSVGQPASRRLHPKGAFIEDFQKIADKLGANVVVVPNLETSTIDEQVAWFADMTSKGVVPHTVELGSEFYIALIMDAAALKIWPDYETSMKRMKAYYDAFEKHLPDDHKVSIQAAASRFHHTYLAGGNALNEREWNWDSALKPEPWFDAVTTHLYTTFSAPAGPAAMKGLPGTYEAIYKAMLARTDAGFTRHIKFLEEKLPGKEIWVTEWGGFDPQITFSNAPIKFDGAWLNMVARSLLVFLRHPTVTVTNYHALFASGNLSSLFRRRPGGGYQPTTAASLFKWVDEASKGPGVRYRQLTVDGAARVDGKTTIEGESYEDVMGGLFEREASAVAIVQNAALEAKKLDVSGLMGGKAPVSAEAMGADDLRQSYEQELPPVKSLTISPEIELPAHSIVRLAWS
ncbi:MAG: hypothetical protein H6923_07850 [Alphaproteobacteria bacterium]|nr:hypothetical protein [Alphaproteobacteria bacterium]